MNTIKKSVMKKLTLAICGLFSSITLADIPMDYGFMENPIQFAKDWASYEDPGQVFQSFKMLDTSDWDSQTIKASQLFDGFKSFESWIVKENSNERAIYSSETAVLLSRVISQQELERLKEPAFISAVDGAFNHTSLSSDEALSEFKQAQVDGQVSAELSLKTETLKDKVAKVAGVYDEEEIKKLVQLTSSQRDENINQAHFCTGKDSVCLKSSAIFDDELRMDIKNFQDNIKNFPFGEKLSSKVPDKIEILSELRTPTQGELGSATAGIIQTGFLASKFIISSKIKIFAYDLKNGTSLLTVKTYVEFEKDDLEKIPSVILDLRKFVQGKTSYNDRPYGFAKGLPAYSSDLIKALAEKL